MAVKWSLLPPVGGISIVEHFGLALHPIRVQLERKVGRDVLAYFFQKEKKAAAKEAADKEAADRENSSSSKVSTSKSDDPSPTKTTFSLTRPDEELVSLDPPDASDPDMVPASSYASISAFEDKLAAETAAPPPPKMTLSRASSSASIQSGARKRPLMSRRSSSSNLKPNASSESMAVSVPPTHKLRRSKSNQSMRNSKDKNDKDSKTQAEEMRSRASSNRTFVYVNVASTTLVLSYKGDKAKSITDLFDLKFATPNLEYHNRTLSFEELIHEFKYVTLLTSFLPSLTRADGVHILLPAGASSARPHGNSEATSSPSSSRLDLGTSVLPTSSTPSHPGRRSRRPNGTATSCSSQRTTGCRSYPYVLTSRTASYPRAAC